MGGQLLVDTQARVPQRDQGQEGAIAHKKEREMRNVSFNVVTVQIEIFILER